MDGGSRSKSMLAYSRIPGKDFGGDWKKHLKRFESHSTTLKHKCNMA